jgi:hypothetical protein
VSGILLNCTFRRKFAVASGLLANMACSLATYAGANRLRVMIFTGECAHKACDRLLKHLWLLIFESPGSIRFTVQIEIKALMQSQFV